MPASKSASEDVTSTRGILEPCGVVAQMTGFEQLLHIPVPVE
jgi:hypothetical protein